MRRVTRLPRWLQRLTLKWRIERLRWAISAAVESLDEAHGAADGLSVYLDGAHRSIRQLRAELALLERPETLLSQAMQNREWR